MRTATQRLLTIVLSCGLSLTAAPSVFAANDLYVEPFDASQFTAGLPTDADSVRVRSILANANKYGLTYWWNTAKDYDAQTGTYLNFGGTAEGNIRPAASEAYALAVALATGGYDAAATGVSSAAARTIALKLTRSLAFRHRVNTAAGWGYGWQTGLWAAMAGAAGWLLWGDLSATDREYVRKMVEFEANRFIGWQVPYWKDRSGNPSRPCEDTAAEESAWNARLLFLAPTMMPQHSRRSGWTYKANELSIGAFARPLDIGSTADIRGRPLNDWLEGTNINNDGSLVNHNRYHPDYMTTISEMISGGLTSALGGAAVPTNSLRGTSLEYDAIVDKQWWPAPAIPCHDPDSPPFINPGPSNPTGTMYVDGSDAVYYPEGNDWGVLRRAHFAELDVMVRAYGLDSLVAEKATVWEDLHAQKELDMQLRPLDGGGASDGRTYRGPYSPANVAEDIYTGREEWAAARAAEMWLTKWLDHQGALVTTNSSEQIVIDNADRGVTVVGTWTTGSPASNGPQVFGPSVRYKAAGTGSSYVRFAPRMTATRTYDVYAWWVAAPSQATNATFTVVHDHGTTLITKNQQANGGSWVLLERFIMGPGDYVQLSDNANGYVVADAILLDPIGP
jgi:hypothetical protein